MSIEIVPTLVYDLGRFMKSFRTKKGETCCYEKCDNMRKQIKVDADESRSYQESYVKS